MTRTDAWAFRGRRMAMPGFGRVMGGVLKTIAREYRLRRQVAYLLQQDHRMLADLGLTHHDVARVVRRGRDL
jgi:uncharacterized protein YjiS (DUF1127 family)